MTAAVDLTYFLEYIKKDAASPDENIVTQVLASATAAAETDMGGTPIVQRSFTSRVRAECDGMLMLPKTPVVEVTAISEVYPSGTVWDIASFVVDDPAIGLVGMADGTRLPETYGIRRQAYLITYTAGLFADVASVDDPVREAVCIIGQHLWRSRFTGGSRPGSLGRTSEFDNETMWRAPAGFAVPARARQLLVGYHEGATVA